MAADGLATQGARSSATMVLIKIAQNILVSAIEVLVKYLPVMLHMVELFVNEIFPEQGFPGPN